MGSLIEFLFEMGQLKNAPRSGWWTVRAPKESVAEHTFRTASVAHILAKMAKLSEKEELMLIKAAIYHDLHEARITDLHMIAKKYVKADEKKCEEEQLQNLPKEIKEDIEGCLNLPPKLQIYLKDADKLECALQAKEYLDLGYKTKDWIENTKKIVKSKEAKLLLKKLETESSLKWLSKDRKD